MQPMYLRTCCVVLRCMCCADEVLHLVLETLTAALKASPEAAAPWEPHISGGRAVPAALCCCDIYSVSLACLLGCCLLLVLGWRLAVAEWDSVQPFNFGASRCCPPAVPCPPCCLQSRP
jgi:hypothetical protein